MSCRSRGGAVSKLNTMKLVLSFLPRPDRWEKLTQGDICGAWPSTCSFGSALFTFLSKYKKLNFRIVCSYCYVTPKRYAPVAAQRELLLASCTTEHHVHLGGGGGYRPQRVGFTLFGLSSGRREVLAMRLYLLTMCPSPNSARLSCAQRNAPPHPPHYWYHRECSVVLAVLCSRFCQSIRN